MSTLADPTRSWAVLIGAPHYKTLPEIPAVEQNLLTLRRLMTDPTVWGLPIEQCLIPQVTGVPDPLESVMTALRTAADAATDTLFVYYAGHGLSDPLSDRLVLALPGGESMQFSYKALAYEQIRSALVNPALGISRRIVVLDCCYSALALDGEMGGDRRAGTALVDSAEVSGAYVLTACAETSVAMAPVGETYTAFTGELVDLLEYGIADGPELLDMSTLYRELQTRLVARKLPEPQQRSRNLAGDLAIACNRAYESPRPAVQRAETAMRILRRSGDYQGAAQVLNGQGNALDADALRRRIRVLRRAHRHAEAAALLRLLA
ncbi:caspase family protein [Micromonospora sp. C31]|uniref:caspase family protein n=1 Tax=Micromonospora sp. C31 TaxID=2824876 RepID=UPI001B37F346|nr:caspase family protein [Micromonospora sp. C31]MBQ1075655.1 caspase family protein [Micromonospora sp. C31]